MTALDVHLSGRPSSEPDREKLILDTLCQDFQSFFYLDFDEEMVTVTKSNDETRLFLDGGRIEEDKPSHELFDAPESPRLISFLQKVL